MKKLKKRTQAERLESWIGRNLGNIFYIVGSIVWGIIVAILIKNRYDGN